MFLIKSVLIEKIKLISIHRIEHFPFMGKYLIERHDSKTKNFRAMNIIKSKMLNQWIPFKAVLRFIEVSRGNG